MVYLTNAQHRTHGRPQRLKRTSLLYRTSSISFERPSSMHDAFSDCLCPLTKRFWFLVPSLQYVKSKILTQSPSEKTSLSTNTCELQNITIIMYTQTRSPRARHTKKYEYLGQTLFPHLKYEYSPPKKMNKTRLSSTTRFSYVCILDEAWVGNSLTRGRQVTIRRAHAKR